ncbi:hypothetical protein CHL79_00015 [Delftia acidovorans]|nr:hypothetical protein CHL79_00015 [Delftia acidovorans]
MAAAGRGLGDAPPQASASRPATATRCRAPRPTIPTRIPSPARPMDGQSRRQGLLRFTTAPLPRALSFYGEASLDLWLSATAGDTDVQVTVSEVRPTARRCSCSAAGCVPPCVRWTASVPPPCGPGAISPRPPCARCAPASPR